jgi:histidine triad (HIT) family protein
MSQTCAVCNKHKTNDTLPGGPIYEDENVFIAHFPHIETEAAHYGHIILEMKRHITRPSEMTYDESTALGVWTQKISERLEKRLSAEHVYVVRIGDVTPHLHFHFIPRFAGTPREAWGPLLNRWPGGRKASPEDMIEITKWLRHGDQK